MPDLIFNRPGAAMTPAVSPEVADVAHTMVLLALADQELAEAASAALGDHGYLAVRLVRTGTSPAVVIADMEHVFALVEKHPGVPLILVNVSGPESMMGKPTHIRPAAFVKHPASAEALLLAVRRIVPGG